MADKSSERRKAKTKSGLLAELESARQKITQLEAERAHPRKGASSAATPLHSPAEPNFRSLIEGSLQAIFVGQNEHAVFVNQAYADLFGYQSPDELIGHRHADFAAPDEHDRLIAYGVDRMQGKDAPSRYQYRVIRKDCSTIWIDSFRQLIEWNGKPAILATLSDITAQKQAEAQVHEHANQLQQVFDTMPHMMAMKDTDGRFLLVNKALCEFWNLTPEELIGKSSAEIPGRSAQEREDAAKADRQALQGDLPIHWYERPLINAQGKARSMLTAKTPIKNKNGEVTGLVAVVLDITEQKQAEEKLRESQRLLQTIFDALPISVVVKDAYLRFILINQAGARRHGRDPAEYHGHTSEELSPMTEEVARKTREEYQWVFEHGETLEFPELRVQYTDKEDQWHRVIRTPLVDDEGQVTGVVTIREDITEQKQAAQNLEQNRNLLQTVFDTTPVGLFVKDAEGRYLMANHYFCELVKLKAEDIQGKLPEDIWDRDLEEVARSRTEDRYVMETDSQLEIPASPVTIGNKTEWYYVVKSPLHDHAGKVIGLVSSQMNITGRLYIESQLRNMEKMEAVGKLAGGMAHEFNNILHMILGFTELMLEITPSGDSRHDNLNTIKNASEKGAGLVRQLLGYSRKQILQPQLLDLNDLLASTTHIMMTTLGGQIVFQLNPGQNLPRVFADGNSIEQILLNLCLNARDAMPGGGNLSIVLRGVYLDEAYCSDHEWAKPGGYVRLSVTDSGTGIPEDVLPHIFDPFFTTKGPQDGSGLGLSMVHGLMEQQRGCINIITEPGQGTTFELYFPVPESEGVNNLQPTRREPEPGQAGAPPPVVVAPVRGTILIVEDETGIQQLSQQVLAARGYRVLHAFNGMEGLRLFERHIGEIDLVLLDVIMPGMDGKELYEKIAAFKASTPVVFHSGYHLDARYTQYIADKGVKLLRKPYSSAQLIGAVEEALAESKGR